MTETNFQHLLNFVKTADQDRYLSTLFAPENKRMGLLSLYAFNIELASIREKISQPMTGEIRLQWWRDLLEAGDLTRGLTRLASDEKVNLETETIASPLARSLLETIKHYALPLQPFLGMIEARTFDLYDDPMPDRNYLEGYCGETASALIQLGSLILDADAAQKTADMAGHAGCAQAIAGLSRLIPISRQRGQCYLPKSLLNAVGLTSEEFIRGEDKEGAQRAISAFIALGQEHLTIFEQHAKKLPASLRPAYLPLALTGSYFNRIQSGRIDPIHQIATISPLKRYGLITMRAFKGW